MMMGCRSMMLFCVHQYQILNYQPISHPITSKNKHHMTHHAATVRHGRLAARAAASCCASAAARSASSACVAEGFFPLRLFGLTSLPPGPLTPPLPAPPADAADDPGGGDGGCCGCLGLAAAAAVESGAIAVARSIVVASDAAAGALPLTPTAAVGSRRRRMSAPVPRLANVCSMAVSLWLWGLVVFVWRGVRGYQKWMTVGYG